MRLKSRLHPRRQPERIEIGDARDVGERQAGISPLAAEPALDSRSVKSQFAAAS